MLSKSNLVANILTNEFVSFKIEQFWVQIRFGQNHFGVPTISLFLFTLEEGDSTPKFVSTKYWMQMEHYQRFIGAIKHCTLSKTVLAWSFFIQSLVLWRFFGVCHFVQKRICGFLFQWPIGFSNSSQSIYLVLSGCLNWFIEDSMFLILSILNLFHLKLPFRNQFNQFLFVINHDGFWIVVCAYVSYDVL